MAYGDSIVGSCVYVVADEDGWFKIGVTADIDLRLYQISRDTGFKPVRLVHTVDTDRDSAKVENLAHWALIDYEHRNEWFKAPEKVVINTVMDAFRRHNAGERIEKKFAVHRRFALIDSINDRIPAVLKPGETRHRFIERAVLTALSQRETAQDGR